MNPDTWLNDNSGGTLSESSGNVGFREIGDTVHGVITSTPRVVETQYGDRLVFDVESLDGTTAQTENGQIQNGDTVTVWVKPGAMARAVSSSVKTDGATGLAIGGTLALKHSALGDKKPGRHPAKLFESKYTQPAAATTNVDDLFA